MRSEGFSRIYFFTPFFGYTGSEVALFNLVVRIKNLDVIVVSRSAGLLAERLPTSVRYFDYQSFKDKYNFRYRIKKKLGHKTSLFEHFLNKVVDPAGSLFYVNTILLPDVVSYLAARQYRFILHAHELQQMLDYVKPTDLDNMIRKSDFVFTSSLACKRLWQTLGRHHEIEVSYPGVEINKDLQKTDSSDLRLRLNIRENVFVIGMSGTLDQNKNPEGFLELGRILRSRGLNVHLLWIGVHQATGYTQYLSHKTKEYRLEDNCTWLGKIDGPEYLSYLNIVDCFVLTSFRESFSIVLVEALALGKPVISFKSGGPQEIINDEAIGVLVDGYSVELMANVVEKLINGNISFSAARSIRRAEEFAPEVAFRRWWELMQPRVGPHGIT